MSGGNLNTTMSAGVGFNMTMPLGGLNMTMSGKDDLSMTMPSTGSSMITSDNGHNTSDTSSTHNLSC